MKKYSLKFLILLVVSYSLMTTGCSKLADYIVLHPGSTINDYPIQKFIYTDPYSKGYFDTVVFTYNQFGDPISGIRPEPRTGAPNYLFKYKNRRLTDFIGVYANGTSTEYWHKFFYNSYGQIILDSVYIFPDIINGNMSNPYDWYIITFGYDHYGRIIKDITTYSNGYTRVQDYSYDAEGNRTGAVYDRKINFHRTNKVWMFLDRDYSINNPFTATSYNMIGLPTKITLNTTNVFLGNYYSEATVVYKK